MSYPNEINNQPYLASPCGSAGTAHQLIVESLIAMQEKVGINNSEDANSIDYKIRNIALTPGPKGDTGLQGETGLTGAQGVPGEVGVPGTKGDTGEQGLQGIPGNTGLQGDPGVKGDTGETGAAGTPGAQGEQGIQGEPGSDASVTKANVEAVLTGEISSHTHAGGSAFEFPVGAVYTELTGVNPATTFGYGTWAAFGAGRVLVGLDSGDPDFDVVEETGGAKTVQSSAQTFGGNVLATHQHDAITAGTPAGTVAAIAATGTAAVKIGTAGATGAANSHTHGAPAFTGEALATHQHAAITAGTPAGSNTPGAATSVVQPYIVVYFWERTV